MVPYAKSAWPRVMATSQILMKESLMMSLTITVTAIVEVMMMNMLLTLKKIKVVMTRSMRVAKILLSR